MNLIDVLTDNTQVNIAEHWNPPKCTGLVVKCQHIFNVCAGTVVYVGRSLDSGQLSVNVRINDTQLVRYVGFVIVDVEEGDEVSTYDYLGQCKDTCRFEYCTDEVSAYPVRVYQTQWYKHDPTCLIDGTDTLHLYQVDNSVQDSYIEDTQDLDALAANPPDKGAWT